MVRSNNVPSSIKAWNIPDQTDSSIRLRGMDRMFSSYSNIPSQSNIFWGVMDERVQVIAKTMLFEIHPWCPFNCSERGRFDTQRGVERYQQKKSSRTSCVITSRVISKKYHQQLHQGCVRMRIRLRTRRLFEEFQKSKSHAIYSSLTRLPCRRTSDG